MGLSITSQIRVFACEEQPIVVEGLLRAFERCGDITLTGSVPVPGPVILSQLQDVDVLLLGQPPAARSALPLLASVAETQGSLLPIVVWVSDLTEMDVFRALQMGARGVLRRTQSVGVLLECLRAVASGSVWVDPSMSSRVPRGGASMRITAREREVIEHVCRGMKNRDIARAMSITQGTVKVHLMHIFEKTGVRDRFTLALQGRQILSAAGTPAAPADDAKTG
jgi:two-component system, NarL family, nitrate/nitrite response regulator NarL